MGMLYSVSFIRRGAGVSKNETLAHDTQHITGKELKNIKICPSEILIFLGKKPEFERNLKNRQISVHGSSG